MGQQQLILLVLATVIVGVAIVVGIRAFTENSAKSNADAMLQDAVRIANDIQAWDKKPEPFGGGAGAGVETATLADIGLGAADGVYENLNGVFELNAGTITGYNATEQNQVTVEIDPAVDNGHSDESITGTFVCLGGVAPADGSDCTVTEPTGTTTQ